MGRTVLWKLIRRVDPSVNIQPRGVMGERPWTNGFLPNPGNVQPHCIKKSNCNTNLEKFGENLKNCFINFGVISGTLLDHEGIRQPKHHLPIFKAFVCHHKSFLVLLKLPPAETVCQSPSFKK